MKTHHLNPQFPGFVTKGAGTRDAELSLQNFFCELPVDDWVRNAGSISVHLLCMSKLGGSPFELDIFSRTPQKENTEDPTPDIYVRVRGAFRLAGRDGIVRWVHGAQWINREGDWTTVRRPGFMSTGEAGRRVFNPKYRHSHIVQRGLAVVMVLSEEKMQVPSADGPKEQLNMVAQPFLVWSEGSDSFADKTFGPVSLFSLFEDGSLIPVFDENDKWVEEKNTVKFKIERPERTIPQWDPVAEEMKPTLVPAESYEYTVVRFLDAQNRPGFRITGGALVTSFYGAASAEDKTPWKRTSTELFGICFNAIKGGQWQSEEGWAWLTFFRDPNAKKPEGGKRREQHHAIASLPEIDLEHLLPKKYEDPTEGTSVEQQPEEDVAVDTTAAVEEAPTAQPGEGASLELTGTTILGAVVS